jgi:hypothetical protein
MQQFILALTALIAIVAIYVLYLKVSRVEKASGELAASFNLYVEERAEDDYVTQGELHGDVLPAVVDYVNELVEEEAQRTETCIVGREGNAGRGPRCAEAEWDDDEYLGIGERGEAFYESDDGDEGKGGEAGGQGVNEEESTNLPPRVWVGPRSKDKSGRAKAEEGLAEKTRRGTLDSHSTRGPLFSAGGGTDAETKLRRRRNGQRLLQSLQGYGDAEDDEVTDDDESEDGEEGGTSARHTRMGDMAAVLSNVADIFGGMSGGGSAHHVRVTTGGVHTARVYVAAAAQGGLSSRSESAGPAIQEIDGEDED